MLRYYLVVIVLVLAGCQREPPAKTVAAGEYALAVGEGPRDFPGLHNVCRVSDKLISGGLPEGDQGFATLTKLQVRTVISVDGARPDVERARRFGLRYVHLPIGYDGVPRPQALRIARAVRDLPGPVYIHCHHGKHRSPAAAAACWRCLDGQCSAERAAALLRQAGTSPHYQGLHAAVHQFTLVSPEELDRVPADFPEVALVSGLVKLMVDLETHWDQVKRIRDAGWKTPPQHPDIDPPHEAGLVCQDYEQASRLPEVAQAAPELRRWLDEAAENARQLRALLAPERFDPAAAERAYQRMAVDCSRCHARFRDAPRP